MPDGQDSCQKRNVIEKEFQEYMEQKKKVFNAVEEMLKSSFGEKVRQRLFQELSNQEIGELLRNQVEPFNSLMAYYKCALMEIETKFRVLNEEFSLQESVSSVLSRKIFISWPPACWGRMMCSLLKKRIILPIQNQTDTEVCISLWKRRFFWAPIRG